ncbi:MAG TPA: helix-hairpin-helix domain-containing protein [bacterium]|nr:helix-hairpin-helix domain-containing protein [bacterium]
MTRGLTSKQKAMICAIIAALVSAALLRVYLSSREATRVRLEAERTDEVLPHIVVHVKGAVKRPGLATLEAGSRVADAVEAAGGFSDESAAASTNLAARVNDGDEIIIGGRARASVGSAVNDKLQPGEKIDINAAPEVELQRLPGIGPTYAARIVELRNRRGPFRSAEEIMLVQGIGEVKFSRLKDFIKTGAK